MGLSRKGKLVRNLVLSGILLFSLWLWLERPLPVALDYRRQEKAQFLEPKEIIQRIPELDCVASRDEAYLYLYSREWYSRIDRFPLEQDVGRMLFLPASIQVQPQDRPADPLVVLAFEDSEKAVRAEIELTTWSTPYETDGALYDPRYTYQAEAEREGKLFFLELHCQEPLDETGVTVYGMCEAALLEDIWNYECRDGYNWYSTGGYDMEITFFDAANRVVAVLIDSVTFPENR